MADDTIITPPFEDGARLMITNGGPHPPGAWATLTAEAIAPVGANLTGARRIAALTLQAKIIEALTPHHEKVQVDERGHLERDASRMLADHDPEPYLDEVMADITKAAQGTDWEAHFADPERQALIRRIVGEHFASAQHIERSWHADRNPHLVEAQELRGRHHPGPVEP